MVYASYAGAAAAQSHSKRLDGAASMQFENGNMLLVKVPFTRAAMVSSRKKAA
jgi:hypothetical protein